MTDRCRIVTAGRDGCGCVTCRYEIEHGTPVPLSAYPLKTPQQGEESP